MTDRPRTTRACPQCGGTRLRLFRSLNYKQCDACLARFPWTLAPGQAPLLGPSHDRQ